MPYFLFISSLKIYVNRIADPRGFEELPEGIPSLRSEFGKGVLTTLGQKMDFSISKEM